ncbi:hypothetical protein [Marinobacter sp. BGYM27]|uniref:golvesin C-terminal-like domain-containing protein n=1 Tax=Marinobacter sp. BGYM27 TaxID=2975597 RepID=UPI0021A67EE4|nr:hypothetical protein [Marinobacter sp. BGYM27]MDG5501684.1 hypothetical protein [Marinobacter sp. BGYM27]
MRQLYKSTNTNRPVEIACAVMMFLVPVVCEADRVWNYEYDENGLMTEADGPRTDVQDIQTYTYDTSGNLVRSRNALGHEVNLSDYTVLGLPQRIVDGNDVVTEVTYNFRGQATSQTTATGQGNITTLYEYDPVGLLTKITRPDGQDVSYEYDPARRLTAIEVSSGDRIEFEHDAMGNVTLETTKGSSNVVARQHKQVFDELGRVIRVIGAENRTTEYRYDVDSNLVSTIDGNSQETRRSYDALNRLSQITDPDSGTITFTYDDMDNLVSVTDQRGLQTTYEYNFAGELTARHSPDTGTTTYSYDSAGNRIRKTDARGVVAEYAYDALNRLISITYPGSPEENIEYGYDDNAGGNYGVGRLTSISDRSGIIQYVYDALGRTVREERTMESTLYVTDYAYNSVSQLISITYPSGRLVLYNYDTDGELVSIGTQGPAGGEPQIVADQLDFLPFGPLARLVYGNGIARQLSYNDGYEPTAIQSPVMDKGYTYDGAGNIAEISDYLDPDQNETFFYDAKGQLTDATGPYGQITYAYDAVGNRLLRSILDSGQTLTENYTYAADSNRLVDVASDKNGTLDNRTFAYSEVGNTISDTTSAKSRELIYNARNRLQEIEEDGATQALYLHNALGQRVVKVAQEPASNLHFHYDQSGHLIAESKPSGEVVREYIYLNDLPVAMLAEGGAGGETPELVIDNSDTRASSVGTWTESVKQAGYVGDNYQANAAGSGADVFQWEPGLTQEATYEVYARWTSHSNRASNAQYVVAYNGVNKSVVVNQRNNGSSWQLLGTFELGPESIISLSDGANGYVIADAIKLTLASTAPSVIITDNTSSDTSSIGEWPLSTNQGGYEGDNYAYHSKGVGENTFTWSPPLSGSGTYQVYAKWTSHYKRASNAKYIVQTANGPEAVTKNQRSGGGSWQLLGTYELTTGFSVSVSDSANGAVIADAIKVERVNN